MSNFEYFRAVHTPAACQLKFLSVCKHTILETHIGFPLSFILASYGGDCIMRRVIKSRRMRWTGHVAHMGEEGGGIGS